VKARLDRQELAFQQRLKEALDQQDVEHSQRLAQELHRQAVQHEMALQKALQGQHQEIEKAQAQKKADLLIAVQAAWEVIENKQLSTEKAITELIAALQLEETQSELNFQTAIANQDEAWSLQDGMKAAKEAEEYKQKKAGARLRLEGMEVTRELVKQHHFTLQDLRIQFIGQIERHARNRKQPMGCLASQPQEVAA
jgi:hypothetical protein